MTAPDLLSAANEVARDVGAPKGFFVSILREDDWSFVIKIHALVEAGVSHLIIEALRRNELEDLIARLAINNERTGKMAFLKDLNLLDKKYRKFISALSTLRNQFAHSVKNVSGTIEGYIGGIDGAKKTQFIKDLAMGAPDPIKIQDREIPLAKFIEEYPKVHIWMSVMDLLGDVHIQNETHRLHSRYVEFAENFGEAIRKVAMRPLQISEEKSN